VAASKIVRERLACDVGARPSLEQRELLSGALAVDLAAMFKVLGSDTRLRLLHALARAGELCVSDLAGELGMAPQAISNQLQRLADRRILAARRDGNRILYRVVDPCVPALLDLGLCLTEEAGAASPGL
jgi:ArsR family transcriptional regulator, lead/cadmium/zinc/bismuth-responsive transcriptional repressor